MSSKKEKYYDWYRAFVQMLMSRGVMTGMACDWSVVIVTFVYSGNSKFVHNVLYALVPYFFYDIWVHEFKECSFDRPGCL